MKSQTPQDRVGKIEEIPCALCDGVRSHTVRGAYDSSWSIDEAGMAGGTEHDLLECNGCHAGTYRQDSWSTEDLRDRSVTYWPPRPNSDQRRPKNYNSMPYGAPLEAVYRQTITALNQDLRTLAGAGVRLLIEGLCKDRRIKKGVLLDARGKARLNRANKRIYGKNLEGKINGMAERGLITKGQAKVLHQIRFLGNESAHELYVPPRDVLIIALEIVEHIFTQVYEQPEHGKSLAGRKRPRRDKRK